ncbi:VWA domain-containing protein [Candidatus Methanocrinis natronophilus]|uniref:VWA domain-containing protein n=1 Tax=Candidatus Methanocrinis natronophilus TaxID=3033396 RepID=A0ABT5X7I9_9EURY|nr:VWA domain-containing protein [Candidatus Methanocrinis natronophilus]MDF0590662.1 VWA domain-containing protein [Candidatus Methanocrinis natronophilus]
MVPLGFDPAHPPDQEVAALLRRNLDRNYGCKVFFVGSPVMGIRIPRERAGMITGEDGWEISSILSSKADSIRKEEISSVFVLGDESLIGMDFLSLESLALLGRRSAEGGSCDLPEILNQFAKTLVRTCSKSAASGRRAEVLAAGKRGRYVRARIPRGKTDDIALAPTIRAALARPDGIGSGGVVIREEDLREKVRRRKASTLVGIVLDSSFSMEEWGSVAEKVVMELLKDAYQRRDRVALVSCSGREAKVVLPFTPSVETARRHLDDIEYAGTTPLASGLLTGSALLAREREKEPSAVPILVLITDGTANVPLEVAADPRQEAEEIAGDLGRSGVHLLVVDVRAGGSDLAERIAIEAGGRYVKPLRPSQEEIYAAIKGEQREASGTRVERTPGARSSPIRRRPGG